MRRANLQNMQGTAAALLRVSGGNVLSGQSMITPNYRLMYSSRTSMQLDRRSRILLKQNPFNDPKKATGQNLNRRLVAECREQNGIRI